MAARGQIPNSTTDNSPADDSPADDVARTPAAVRDAMRHAAELQAAGRREEAERYVLRAVTLAPGIVQPLRLLGLLRFERRHFAAAAATLRQALSVAPADSAMRRQLAAALTTMGDLVAAERELRRIIADHFEDSETINNLGLILNRMGRLPEAESCFRKCMRLRPGWAAPVRGLGMVLLRAGQPGKASDYFRRAERILRGEADDDAAPVLRDATLDDGVTRDGLRAIPLELAGDGGAQIVRFPRAVVERRFAMPIAPSGRFFSNAFASFRYPDKYAHLWTRETRDSFVERLAAPDDFAEGLVVPGYAGNYGHWLLDALPAFLALKRVARARMTVIVDGLQRYRHESLARFARIHALPEFDIAVTQRPFYAISDAHFVTQIARPAQVAAVAAMRLARPPHRLLFVGRRGAHHRHLLNEDAVFDALKPLGFENVDPARVSFEEQLTLFSEARAVVGVQGAALANCLFAPPGTPLVVLFAGRLMPYYLDLARHIPLRMAEVGGEIRDDHPDLRPEHCNFAVDIAAVTEAARRALDTEPMTTR